MVIVSRITNTSAMVDGWRIVSELTEIHMTDDWFCRYRPVVGDYLTYNNDGYYAVIPLQAYNAVRQFYLV
jgi:hypothetical protein